MNLTPPMLEAAMRRTKPDPWEAPMGTVAEAWLEQGRAEGIEKGREEGRAEALVGFLLRQLELRFRDVPGPVRDRVRGASIAQLEAWAEAVLTAARLNEVMATGPRR